MNFNTHVIILGRYKKKMELEKPAETNEAGKYICVIGNCEKTYCREHKLVEHMNSKHSDKLYGGTTCFSFVKINLKISRRERRIKRLNEKDVRIIAKIRKLLGIGVKSLLYPPELQFRDNYCFPGKHVTRRRRRCRKDERQTSDKILPSITISIHDGSFTACEIDKIDIRSRDKPKVDGEKLEFFGILILPFEKKTRENARKLQEILERREIAFWVHTLIDLLQAPSDLTFACIKTKKYRGNITTGEKLLRSTRTVYDIH